MAKSYVQEINAQHDKAMNLAALADLDRMRDNMLEADNKYYQAFELELKVAQYVIPTSDEPNRSVILRSAASLAIDCGEYREAEKLIATALASDPPPSIANELRDLLMQVMSQLQRAIGD